MTTSKCDSKNLERYQYWFIHPHLLQKWVKALTRTCQDNKKEDIEKWSKIKREGKGCNKEPENGTKRQQSTMPPPLVLRGPQMQLLVSRWGDKFIQTALEDALGCGLNIIKVKQQQTWEWGVLQCFSHISWNRDPLSGPQMKPWGMWPRSQASYSD